MRILRSQKRLGFRLRRICAAKRPPLPPSTPHPCLRALSGYVRARTVHCLQAASVRRERRTCCICGAAFRGVANAFSCRRALSDATVLAATFLNSEMVGRVSFTVSPSSGYISHSTTAAIPLSAFPLSDGVVDCAWTPLRSPHSSLSLAPYLIFWTGSSVCAHCTIN